MIHVLAVLFGLASIAIALVARQKKKDGVLPIIGGGACLGLCFILTLMAVFSKEDSPEEDLFQAIGRAQWEYPISLLAEKMGAPGSIAIIVLTPAPSPGSSDVPAPVNPLPVDCQLQGCSVFIQPLKVGQSHVTLDALNSAIKAGAKGILLAAPLQGATLPPAPLQPDQNADESPGGESGEPDELQKILDANIKVPMIAMSEPRPNLIQNLVLDGKLLGLLGILSVKPNTTEVPDMKTRSPIKELFSARYQLLGHQSQMSQPPTKTKENDNE